MNCDAYIQLTKDIETPNMTAMCNTIHVYTSLMKNVCIVNIKANRAGKSGFTRINRTHYC